MVQVQIWRPENQGNWWCVSSDQSLEGLRNVETNSARTRPGLKVQEQEHQCPKVRENGCPSSSREQIHPFCLFILSGRQDTTHPHWWRRSSLPSLPIQIKHYNTHTNKNQNTITHIPSNYVLPTIWASLSPVEVTHKIITGIHESLNSAKAWVERRQRSLAGQARPLKFTSLHWKGWRDRKSRGRSYQHDF